LLRDKETALLKFSCNIEQIKEKKRPEKGESSTEKKGFWRGNNNKSNFNKKKVPKLFRSITDNKQWKK
jgi:hypothetical protein